MSASSGYSGIYCHFIDGTKGVTMKDVSANGNSWDNVSVYDIAGNVNISNVAAHGSINGEGVMVNTIDGSKGVVLKGVNANGNGTSNVLIQNIEGNVTASTIQANSSSGNHGLDVYQVWGSKGVTLKDIEADDNTQSGIAVTVVSNNVSLAGANADTNGTHGVEMTSISGSKGVSLKDVTADGNNSSNIYMDDISANVNMKSVIASNSVTASGIYLEDIYGTKGVTLKTIDADANDTTDIVITDVMNGNVSMSAVDSVAGGAGISIDNVLGPKGVSLKGVVSSSHNGINIYIGTITGNVDLKDVEANVSSTGIGIQVTSVSGTKGISLNKVIANGNSATNITLSVVSGNVIFKGVQANLGGGNGIYINNVDGIKGVSFTDVTANTGSVHNILIIDVNPGDVVLNKVTANDSTGGAGVRVFNPAAEVMIQNSFFNDNDTDGIQVVGANGLVLLKKIEGNDNDTGSGADLESNNYQLVCSSQFINNAVYGVSADTVGYSITIAGTDLSSVANGSDTSYATPGTTLWENTSSKCKIIPPP